MAGAKILQNIVVLIVTSFGTVLQLCTE